MTKWRYWLMVMGLTLLAMVTEAQRPLNVQNFGGVGDAVQFYANTVSNETFITVNGTNIFSINDIGKAIEVFNCGTNTSSTNCQDMVTTIANVVNGTNIYLNQTCQNTLTNTFATVGTDNSLAFSNAIQSVVNSGSTNTIINVPAGKYLCLSRYVSSVFAPVSILISGGGWHLVGAGKTNTVLLGQGAWRPISGQGGRGFLLSVKPPVLNDYPVSIENLTLDGGVEHGNTSNHTFPASTVDGSGWDEFHSAIQLAGLNGHTFTHWTWTNLLITHWRGEMVKSNGQQTNGNLTITGCTFQDGNASAINIYDSLIITNCIFDNLFMAAEYYQAYSTNANYLVNCLLTNITGNAWSINGGKGSNPYFFIQGNIFYGVNGNGVATTPGDNIRVTSNQFVNVAFPVVIGSAGYQGTYINSNIVVNYNTMLNAQVVFQAGAYLPDNVNVCSDVSIYGNVITRIYTSLITAQWAYNTRFYSNVVASLPDEGTDGNNRAFLQTGIFGAPCLLVETNNFYWTPRYDLTGQTNFFNYSRGSRYQVIYGSATNVIYALVTTNAGQIPAGASIIVTNSTIYQGAKTTTNVPVYLNSDLSGDPVVIPQYGSQTFYWNKIKGGYAWMTNKIVPPLNLRTNL